MKSELLDKNRSVLVLIDFQEKLFPNVHDYESLLPRIDLLLSAAHLLHIPVLLTEQYPKGLGSTIEPIRKTIPQIRALEKMSFSCLGASDFKEWLASFRRDQVILAGIETHICVSQTAMELAAQGSNVFVLADVTSSRRPLDAQIALHRLDRGGLTITTSEAVVFEWLRRAGTDEFKAIQPMLKALQ